MRIKKFTASNYADALEQVKSELGDDALIMSTRSIKLILLYQDEMLLLKWR